MLVIEKLILAYTNEKCTITLLPYNTIVDDFNRIVMGKTRISKNLSDIEELELQRIKYFIKEYILCRFDKITKNYYLDINLMSDSEKIFYVKFLELHKKFEVYQENQNDSESIRENEFVGFIANRNIPDVKIDKEVVEVFEGDVFIASLEDVYSYLLDNSISLI